MQLYLVTFLVAGTRGRQVSVEARDARAAQAEAERVWLPAVLAGLRLAHPDLDERVREHESRMRHAGKHPTPRSFVYGVTVRPAPVRLEAL